MLIDWAHWISGKTPEQLLALLWALVFLDGPRYALSKVTMCLWDVGRGAVRYLAGRPAFEPFTHCPSVCVVIPAYNEEECIAATLASVWGTYPRLEIVVIDDCSEDRTSAIARMSGEGCVEHQRANDRERDAHRAFPGSRSAGIPAISGGLGFPTRAAA